MNKGLRVSCTGLKGSHSMQICLEKQRVNAMFTPIFALCFHFPVQYSERGTLVEGGRV